MNAQNVPEKHLLVFRKEKEVVVYKHKKHKAFCKVLKLSRDFNSSKFRREKLSLEDKCSRSISSILTGRKYQRLDAN